MRAGLRLRRIHAVDENASAGGLVDAADEVEQGGFAAAAGAGDGQEFAGFDLEADIIEGGDGVVVEGKSARNPVNVNEGGGWSHRGLSFPEWCSALERKIAWTV